MPMSHPPLLTGWRQDVSSRQPPGGMLARTKALRPTVRGAINSETEMQLNAILAGPLLDVLRSSTRLQVEPPAARPPADCAAAPTRLVEVPGAVYGTIWGRAEQPLGMNTFEWTRKKGYEPKAVPKPRSDPQDLRQWFAEYGRPDPNAKLGRRTEIMPSVRLMGTGREAFRTNVRHMRRGAL